MKKLKELFEDKDKFLIGAELVTTRGLLQEEGSKKIVQYTEDLIADERIDWLSVTENAGGNIMSAPDGLGKLIQEKRKNTIIHITCKDMNRNALESIAWKYANDGFENLLALSGDYPIDGYKGVAQPVFDLDSVGLLKMLSDMNKGLTVNGRKPNSHIDLDKTNFFLGCAVSPFKTSEAEQMMQYEKLKLKIKAGANYIIPQLGYDIRKSHELITWLRENNLLIPVIGNIYKLTGGVANLFNKCLIPGCNISDEFLERLQKEKKSSDKGKKYFIDLAAKQYVAFKQMGYKGVYIGGTDKYEDFAAILDKAEELKNSDWLDFVPELTNPLPNEFYLYSQDSKTKLADAKNVNPQITKYKKSNYSKHVSLTYRFNRLVHTLLFNQKSLGFKISVAKYNLLEKKSFNGLRRFTYFNERMIKAALFNCKECGDCSLPDITYLCPQSQCAKNQRNGPCGGSSNDKCELTDRKKDCIWVKAYSRKKYFNGINAELLQTKPVIKNNKLKDSSGWANYFLGGDHNAYKLTKKID
ncbi:MAG: methylenetetrahydrofolate reductase C-terminal domain-containing protein [Bacteroidales bacterium]|jgi:methylenetetrahydrofolate reductase (NADPH)|nr:methylenetetrahydrofolate reductase C-terminal domain-containing protein [Bacteroidales bacterium]